MQRCKISCDNIHMVAGILGGSVERLVERLIVDETRELSHSNSTNSVLRTQCLPNPRRNGTIRAATEHCTNDFRGVQWIVRTLTRGQARFGN